MVFVWSHLTDGDANYTLVQVSVNDIILVFAFAPIAGLLLTVVLLFGFQAETIVEQPVRVVLIAIPLLIQSYGIFTIAGLARLLKLPFNVGVLIEVPVVLSLVAFANRTKGWFPTPSSASA